MKTKPKIQANCDICKHQVLDKRWSCLRCDLEQWMPGLKFKYGNNGKFIYCHNFELRKG